METLLIIFSPETTNILGGFPANFETGNNDAKAHFTEAEMLRTMVTQASEKRDVNPALSKLDAQLLLPTSKYQDLSDVVGPEKLFGEPVKAVFDVKELFRQCLAKQKEYVDSMRQKITSKAVLARINHNEFLVDISCAGLQAFYCLDCEEDMLQKMEALSGANPCGRREVITS
eukprot:TRINITY_DN11067_c0_g1_i4.p1 TRINITY_DN11067_c0_g1~~TRINITY_DN11067_c0_g1_i4.p1  ORF type:complete len:173 (+),score=49.07 TRINITY_DN11067_c0_g1_i4:592-1110(+)